MRTRVAALAAALAGIVAAWPAGASGPAATSPWYLDQYGGDPADLKTFYAGRVGIVMASAPRSMLFISWRLLHGQAVGPAAGDALSQPCCGTPWWAQDYRAGVSGWQDARKTALGQKPGEAPFEWLQTDKEGTDHQFHQNCLPEAFDVAAATLKDRSARYGSGSQDVRAWLASQDSVFKACHDNGVVLPPAPAKPPTWLVRDRAYQAAALALYSGRHDEAAAAFEAIARDADSPWRKSGAYLVVRVRVRQALQTKAPADFARAHAAIAALAAAPEGTFGRGQAKAMESVISFRERPDAFLARLHSILARSEPNAEIAVDFRDYVELGERASAKPEPLDWMDTLKGYAPGAGGPPSDAGELEPARKAALAHAVDRWRASHDLAWLVAGLSLVAPGEPAAAALIHDGEAVPTTSPAWLSVQQHLMRLSLPVAPAAQSRQRLDALLARTDLSVSDRNVFTAQRAQVAADLGDFVDHALRKRLCNGATPPWSQEPRREPPPCARDRWDYDTVQPAGVYDGEGDQGATGFGEDARAVIDRAPLTQRIAISRDRRLPAALRLDVALTSYGRAVLLQDNAAIDGLSRDLAVLLPLVAKEFDAIPAAKPGPDKRFAEFLVLAKIPGVRTDLVPDYTRPAGKRVEDFQSHWADWIVVRAPVLGRAPPELAAYQADGFGAEQSYMDHPGTPDARTDLTCLGECGRGAAPLRLPDFIAAGQAAAQRERGFLVTFAERYDGKPQIYPPGGVAVWDEMLDYCRTHPADPRVPEALHWLVHVGHFGGTHNHSGRRAFRLLHARYEGSYWAKRTPYYND